jgi:hypothetical protein
MIPYRGGYVWCAKERSDDKPKERSDDKPKERSDDKSPPYEKMSGNAYCGHFFNVFLWFVWADGAFCEKRVYYGG